jgi:transcriptional regulator with XRE-family HTH domain
VPTLERRVSQYDGECGTGHGERRDADCFLNAHCGLHRTAISLIERGKCVPSLTTLLTISKGDQETLGRSLLFYPQLQGFKLLLGHALQSHRRGQIQSGNVLHFVAVFYLATELLHFRVSAHSQEHFIRIGDGQSLFNQAMLSQNAMIRRYCQRRWMGRRRALALLPVFHGIMLTRFLDAVISLALKALWQKTNSQS